jgi:segregation and condensation protein A
MESNINNSISVEIPNYSGPLETLLDLAKNQKVDLTKISIAILADHFLEFIRNFKDKNLDTAFEYLVMATWLAYLKSKLLLPEDEEDTFKADEIAEKLKLQLKKLELIRLLSDQLLKKERIGRDIFYRGTKGGIRSINNPVYKVTIYDLLKTYANVKAQSSYQRVDIPRLPVMTTQQAIKQIKENMKLIEEWKKINELVPTVFNQSIALKKSGLAAIFAASLELSKDGLINIRQKNLFDDILIQSAKHTPLKLKTR